MSCKHYWVMISIDRFFSSSSCSCLKVLAKYMAFRSVLNQLRPCYTACIIWYMVNVQLQTEMASQSSEDVSLGTETSTLLSMLSASEARTLKSTLIDFNITLARKWEATCERNLSPEVYGSEGLCHNP